MSEKVLLILGASSECGIEILNKIYKNYKYIYAHYANNCTELMKLKEKIGDKLILIRDDFLKENGGTAVLEVMEKAAVFPEHVIHLPAVPYENLRFHKTGWEVFEKGIQTSVRSGVLILQKVISELLRQKKKGRIVFMLSSYTENTPPKYSSPYVLVKYALLGLMKELSAEYAERGIMVNAVSPSMMETKFLKRIPELVVQQAAANSPFGRNLKVEEVIPVFEFLLSEQAELITGQNIVVSGGIVS